jgi:hypothetical protein
MRVKEFIETEDYKYFENLIEGNVMGNRDILKALFDTSPHCKDIQLIKDIVNVVDRSSIVSYKLKPHTLYLLIKAVSPFVITMSDINFDFTSWARSYLRIYWMNYIDELITNKNKSQ